MSEPTGPDRPTDPVCDRCGEPKSRHQDVHLFCPFYSTFRRAAALAVGAPADDRLRTALLQVQTEVTHKNGGVEAASGVGLTFIKRVVDEALGGPAQASASGRPSYESLARLSEYWKDRAHSVERILAAGAAPAAPAPAHAPYESHSEACQHQAERDAGEGDDPVCTCGAQDSYVESLGAAPGRAPAPEPTNWQAMGRSAVEAAQEVIGQCDCIMAEMPDKDPKRLWYEARDRFLKAASVSGGAPPAARPAQARQEIHSVLEGCLRAASHMRRLNTALDNYANAVAAGTLREVQFTVDSVWDSVSLTGTSPEYEAGWGAACKAITERLRAAPPPSEATRG